jgi:exodeoxyribonuclease X
MSTIRVLDFETTGTAPPAHVIEVGICDVVYSDDREGWSIRAPAARLCGGGTITAETRAIHHISPAEILGFDPFDARAFVEQARADGIAAIAAHHADFEGKWLGTAVGGLPLICTYKGALRIWPDEPSHSNQYLRYRLEELGLSSPDHILCQPAHRAGPDAYATAHLVRALLGAATVDDLINWTKEPAALPRCTIGKFRGVKWSDVDAGYLSWMVKTPDMDADLKWNAQREIKRRAIGTTS